MGGRLDAGALGHQPGDVAATLALLAAAVTLSRYRGPPDGWYCPSAWRAGG